MAGVTADSPRAMRGMVPVNLLTWYQSKMEAFKRHCRANTRIAAAAHARLGVEPGVTDRDLLLAACRGGALDTPALRRACEALGHGSRTDVDRGAVLAGWLSDEDPDRRAAAWELYRGVFLTAEDDGKLYTYCLANEAKKYRHYFKA